MNYLMRVHRDTFLASLGYPSGKIPAGESKVLEDQPVLRREWDQALGQMVVSRIFKATVIIRPTKPAIHNGRRYKTSKHRVFIVCPRCKQEVPYGRLHQHVCKSNMWYVQVKVPEGRLMDTGWIVKAKNENKAIKQVDEWHHHPTNDESLVAFPVLFDKYNVYEL